MAESLTIDGTGGAWRQPFYRSKLEDTLEMVDREMVERE